MTGLILDGLQTRFSVRNPISAAQLENIWSAMKTFSDMMQNVYADSIDEISQEFLLLWARK